MISRKFVFGLGLNLIVRFAGVALGLFVSRWMLTHLDTDEFASYNLIVAYNQIFLLLFELGITTVLQKSYTNITDVIQLRKIWTTFFVVRVASYFVAILLILLTYPLSQTSNLAWIIGLFTAQFIILIDNNYSAVCNSRGQGWQFSITDFIGKVVLVVCLYFGIIFWPTGVSPFVLLILGSIFAYALSLLLDAIWQKEHTRFGAFDFGIIRANFKALTFLSISSLAMAAYATLDKIYLGVFGWSSEVINGYSNAYRMFDLALIVPGILLPQIVSLSKQQIDRAGSTYEASKVFWYYAFFCSVLGVLCSLGLWLVGPVIIRIIDSQIRYPLAFEAMPILALSFLPIFTLSFMGRINIFFGNEKYDLYATVFLAILTNIFYLALIPTWGLFGASWAMVASTMVDLLVKFLFLLKGKKSLVLGIFQKPQLQSH